MRRGIREKEEESTCSSTVKYNGSEIGKSIVEGGVLAGRGDVGVERDHLVGVALVDIVDVAKPKIA